MKIYLLSLTLITSGSVASEKKFEKKQTFDKKYEQLFGEKPSHKTWNKLSTKCDSTGGCRTGCSGSNCKM